MSNSILFISAFPPNQKTAGQDYSRRLINDFVNRGWKVGLIYCSYPNHQIELPESVEQIHTITPSLKNCFAKPVMHPFFTKRFDKNAVKIIQEKSKHYDILYFDFSQVFIYSLFVQHPLKIMMCHDIICQKFGRQHPLQLSWIKSGERKLLKKSNLRLTFSQKDSDILQNQYSLNSTPVKFYLKNDNFKYPDNFSLTDSFCFYGAWNRKENYETLSWFIQKVKPLLSRKLNYIVIGGGLSKELQNELISLGIKVLGFVEDPVLEVSKCQALIAPLMHGAGVKVKVIDALTSGTSVIGTNVTFEGVEDNQEHKLFYNAKKPEDFARIINNWKTVSVESKKLASKEFLDRYNTGHFPDILNKFI